MKRIIISDVHIGSKYYKEQELISFLKSVDYDQLILAGDILDFIKVPQFTARVSEIIKAIKFEKEIIYIVGNHDVPLSGFIGQEVFGVKFFHNYEFEEGDKKFRIEHGDKYDDYPKLIANKIIMSFLSITQNFIENIFGVNITDWITDWKLKRRKLRRIWDILNINKDVDVFICGHSHIPECVIWVTPDQKVRTYVNSGDWVSHQTYILIKDAQVRLLEYRENDDGIEN